MTGIYRGEFKDQASVFEEFEVKDKDRKLVAKILLAEYDVHSYDGEAAVLFEGADGLLYEVYGGHDSCCGLEGQWVAEQSHPGELFKRAGIVEKGGDPIWRDMSPEFWPLAREISERYDYDD